MGNASPWTATVTSHWSAGLPLRRQEKEGRCVLVVLGSSRSHGFAPLGTGRAEPLREHLESSLESTEGAQLRGGEGDRRWRGPEGTGRPRLRPLRARRADGARAEEMAASVAPRAGSGREQGRCQARLPAPWPEPALPELTRVTFAQAASIDSCGCVISVDRRVCVFLKLKIPSGTSCLLFSQLSVCEPRAQLPSAGSGRGTGPPPDPKNSGTHPDRQRDAAQSRAERRGHPAGDTGEGRGPEVTCSPTRSRGVKSSPLARGGRLHPVSGV